MAEVATRQEMALRAYLFEDDGEDREVALSEEVLSGLTEAQLLWIDMDVEDRRAVDTVASVLELEPETVESILAPLDRPHVADFGSYFHVHVFSVQRRRRASSRWRSTASSASSGS